MPVKTHASKGRKYSRVTEHLCRCSVTEKYYEVIEVAGKTKWISVSPPSSLREVDSTGIFMMICESTSNCPSRRRTGFAAKAVAGQKAWSQRRRLQFEFGRSKRPVYKGEAGGEFIGEFVEPRIVQRNVGEPKLDAAQIFRVIHEAHLQAVTFLRRIEPAGLQAGELALGEVDRAILPAVEIFPADIDQPPRHAGVGIGIVDQAPAQALAVAGAAVDEAEIQAGLRILPPDVQGKAVDLGGAGVDGDVRRQRRLENFVGLQAQGGGREGGYNE